MNKQEIAARLIENHQNFARFIASLSEPEFMSAEKNKWTPAQHLDHLARAVAPVKTALSLPRFVPRILFGKARRASTDYESLVKNYREKLAAGAKASGRFIPPAIGFERREPLTKKMLQTVSELNGKIENFSEAQLDEYVLPHPILGKLTIREMLYFTIYHVEHHHRKILESLEK